MRRRNGLDPWCTLSRDYVGGDDFVVQNDDDWAKADCPVCGAELVWSDPANVALRWPLHLHGDRDGTLDALLDFIGRERVRRRLDAADAPAAVQEEKWW